MSLQIVGTATMPTTGSSGGGALHTEMGTGALLSYELIPVSIRDEIGNTPTGPNEILVHFSSGVLPCRRPRNRRDRCPRTRHLGATTSPRPRTPQDTRLHAPAARSRSCLAIDDRGRHRNHHWRTNRHHCRAFAMGSFRNRDLRRSPTDRSRAHDRLHRDRRAGVRQRRRRDPRITSRAHTHSIAAARRVKNTREVPQPFRECHPYFHPYNSRRRVGLAGPANCMRAARRTWHYRPYETSCATRSSKARVRSSAWWWPARSAACTFRNPPSRCNYRWTPSIKEQPATAGGSEAQLGVDRDRLALGIDAYPAGRTSGRCRPVLELAGLERALAFVAFDERLAGA